MQTAQQPCSGNVARARWPARAACRRARLAVKRLAGRVALRCGMVPEEGAGACAMGADCSERCTAARASRREWSCAWLWWCERRVAGAGGAGRPWGASIGLAPMTQASGRCSCVCVRAGTYAQFSRGVRGEGHEGRRPRVYWRVGVRVARRAVRCSEGAEPHARRRPFQKKRIGSSRAPTDCRRTTIDSSAVGRRAGGLAGSSRGHVKLSAWASRKRAPRTATPAVECRELGSTRAPRKSDRLPSSGTPSWRFGRELARAHSKVRARRRDTGERAAGAHFGCGSCQEFALSVHTPLQNINRIQQTTTPAPYSTTSRDSPLLY